MTESTLNSSANHKDISSTMNNFLIINALFTAYILITGFSLSMKVIPTFSEMFAGFGADLPLLTRLVTDFSIIMVCIIVVISAVICTVFKSISLRKVTEDHGKGRAVLFTIFHAVFIFSFQGFLVISMYMPIFQMGTVVG